MCKQIFFTPLFIQSFVDVKDFSCVFYSILHNNGRHDKNAKQCAVTKPNNCILLYDEVKRNFLSSLHYCTYSYCGYIKTDCRNARGVYEEQQYCVRAVLSRKSSVKIFVLLSWAIIVQNCILSCWGGEKIIFHFFYFYHIHEQYTVLKSHGTDWFFTENHKQKCQRKKMVFSSGFLEKIWKL